MHNLCDSPDDADVILFATNYFYRPLGLSLWREPVYRRNRDRFVLFTQEDKPSPIIGGLCASARNDLAEGQASPMLGWHYLHPTVVEPQIKPQPWPDHTRYLWSFKGDFSTHACRQQLSTLKSDVSYVEDTHLVSYLNMTMQTAAAEREHFFNSYIQLMADSAFSVCPRGEGPSSMRIFESMRAGRAPVIISDTWTPPPFVKWDECSLRVSEDQMMDLTQILQQHLPRAKEMGDCARAEWERVFGPRGLFHYTVEAGLLILKQRQGLPLLQRIKKYRALTTPYALRETLRTMSAYYRYCRNGRRAY